MRDGSYSLSLAIDGYIGNGTLTLSGNNGQGHDGVFQVEVHVSGRGVDVRGVVNVFLADEVAHEHRLPQHFSLAVTGAGDDGAFNLIGTGPGGVLVEVDAQWQRALSSSLVDEWP